MGRQVKEFSLLLMQRMASELHCYEQRSDNTMQALEVGATLAGSLATAFLLQRMLLVAWLRAMQHETAVRVENDTARNR